MENHSSPRSLHSRNKIPIHIVNLTNHNIDIIWINFAGEYVKYAMIASRGFMDVNTYETHPWIAINSKTKDRMLINRQFIYMPKHWRIHLADQVPSAILNYIPDNVVPRILIPITLPLYSLRHRTLLAVSSFMKDEDDVAALDLPKQLKDDLKKVIIDRDRFPLNNG